MLCERGCPWREGAAEAAAATATTRARELEEELAGVLQESEALIKEKEALVKEVNIRAQELVEERAENEARRRSVNAEKEEMERQLYALTKDREEALAKFRTERNQWSDKLREAKMKTAKEEAGTRGKVSTLEEQVASLKGQLRDAQSQAESLRSDLDRSFLIALVVSNSTGKKCVLPFCGMADASFPGSPARAPDPIRNRTANE